MRYTYKDLVEMVAAHRRAEFTHIYEYLHKTSNPEDNEIMSKVSSYFEVPVADLKSNKRYADVAFARQVYMATIKVCSTRTLAEVARTVEKDHATVCHAMKTVKRDYQYNAVRRNKIRHFIALLDKSKQELLLDYLNERNPNILTAYAAEPERVTTPSAYQDRITSCRLNVSQQGEV